MEEEGCTIFLPKGHFFSLGLTHKDHLKGSLKHCSSAHSAKGLCEQRTGEASPSEQKGPVCLGRKSSFLKMPGGNPARTPDPAQKPRATPTRLVSGRRPPQGHLLSRCTFRT